MKAPSLAVVLVLSIFASVLVHAQDVPSEETSAEEVTQPVPFDPSANPPVVDNSTAPREIVSGGAELMPLPEENKPKEEVKKSSGPMIGKFELKKIHGGFGGTEQGLVLYGRAQGEASDGSTADLIAVSGSPYIRIRGKTELMPVKLVQNYKLNKDSRENDGKAYVDVSIIPIDLNGQISISDADNTNLSRVIIAPSVAAKLGVKFGKESDGNGDGEMRISGKASPLYAGVVHDVNGTAPAFGIVRLGIKPEVEFHSSKGVAINMGLGVDYYNSVIDASKSGIMLDANFDGIFDLDKVNKSNKLGFGLHFIADDFRTKDVDTSSQKTQSSIIVGVHATYVY